MVLRGRPAEAWPSAKVRPEGWQVPSRNEEHHQSEVALPQGDGGLGRQNGGAAVAVGGAAGRQVRGRPFGRGSRRIRPTGRRPGRAVRPSPGRTDLRVIDCPCGPPGGLSWSDDRLESAPSQTLGRVKCDRAGFGSPLQVQRVETPALGGLPLERLMCDQLDVVRLMAVLDRAPELAL